MRSLFMRGLTAAMCAAAMLSFGVAKAGETQQAANDAPTFVVVHENATIPFARSIDSWEVARDNSLLLRAGSRWYRATTERLCADDLRFHENLALSERGTGSIDKFAHFYVRGRYCYFYSLDQIENPHPRRAS